MSELNTTFRADFRKHLLLTASAVALLASVYEASEAKASEDMTKPVLWIELGGQFEQENGQGDAYLPPFVERNPTAHGFQGTDFHAQSKGDFSNGFQGKLSFEPSNTDWVFSASVIYGRANGTRRGSHYSKGIPTHHKTLFKTYTTTPYGYYRSKHFHCCQTKSNPHTHFPAYGNIQSQFSRAHAIIDFQAGKDVGLGLFGGGGSSVISAGVRFAQFNSRSSATIHGEPNKTLSKVTIHTFGYTFSRYNTLPVHHYAMSFRSTRNFRGVGPSISWNASAPVLGHPQGANISIDWGANAAVLFGRQQASIHHQTTGTYASYRPSIATHYQHSAIPIRKRTVTIPNLGGFAGLSFHYADAKVSLGYRGDFFFGAIDAGNDTRKTETVGFHGPFATVSVGIGG
jgi:iron complex outermembrane receptor protein